MTGPALAATSFMQSLFSFSPLFLQLASYSIAPLFAATLAYTAYKSFVAEKKVEPKSNSKKQSSSDSLDSNSQNSGTPKQEGMLSKMQKKGSRNFLLK